MKTASTTLDIIRGADARKPRAEMTPHELEDTNENPTADRNIADSWFGSVDLVENTDGIFNIKTNSSRYPKAFLQEKMKNWPGGSHLLLEATVNKNTSREKKIYALGYKYCKAKVMFFIFTEGAAHTETSPQYDYIASWRDENYNVHTRRVLRPHAAYVYFNVSNRIDVLNQLRQSELKLEKFWVCRSGFFRIVTTLFGITVVDAFKTYLHHLGSTHHWKNTLTVMEFSDMLALDLLNNQLSKHRGKGVGYDDDRSIRPTPPPPPQQQTPNQSTQTILNINTLNFDSQISDITTPYFPPQDPTPPPPNPTIDSVGLPKRVLTNLTEKYGYKAKTKEGETSDRKKEADARHAKQRKQVMCAPHAQT